MGSFSRTQKSRSILLGQQLVDGYGAILWVRSHLFKLRVSLVPSTLKVTGAQILRPNLEREKKTQSAMSDELE